MRLYTFTHFMLSTMAQGIQSGHATVELFNKYKEIDLYDYALCSGGNPPEHISNLANQANMLFDWSKNHKTHVSLNGGVTPDLHELIKFFEQNNCVYPWSFFEEDDSLGGLVTSVAVILPERIYDVSALIRSKVIAFEGNSLKALNWEYYNSSFIMYEYIALENTCLRYGEYSDFEKELVLKLNSCGLAR